MQLASIDSLFPAGLHIECGLGLSHSIGYALGSPYGILHGITLYISLACVVKPKAQSVAEAAQIARVSPYVGQSRSRHDKADAHTVGDAIDQLVKALSLESTLQQYGFGKDQEAKTTKILTQTEEGELYDGVCAIVKSRH